MINQPIISSLLDQDFYTFSMANAIHQLNLNVNVVSTFKCRNKGVDLTHLVNDINDELNDFCNLQFYADDISCLRKLNYFSESFLTFLLGLRLNRKHIRAYVEDNELKIRISGPILETIWYEVPVLAIVNELHFRYETGRCDFDPISVGLNRLQDKHNLIYDQDNFQFIEMGTRRRFSKHFQEMMITRLAKTGKMIGTSNVFLARRYNIPVKGTQAHLWFMLFQATSCIKDHIKNALDAWLQVYRGKLAIALTDIITTDALLNNFDLLFTKAYDGVRHDSGDPYQWGMKWLKHYQIYNIDTKTKTLCFSNNLDFEKAIDLTNTFSTFFNVVHGIGTYLSNDCGLIPLNIVIKPVEMNGQPVVKISDDIGKGMCESPEYITTVKNIFNI